jgi:hypothetical protein
MLNLNSIAWALVPSETPRVVCKNDARAHRFDESSYLKARGALLSVSTLASPSRTS